MFAFSYFINFIQSDSWCPEIEAPENGNLQLSGRKLGDIAKFTCKPGYKLLGYKVPHFSMTIDIYQ